MNFLFSSKYSPFHTSTSVVDPVQPPKPDLQKQKITDQKDDQKQPDPLQTTPLSFNTNKKHTNNTKTSTTKILSLPINNSSQTKPTQNLNPGSNLVLPALSKSSNQTPLDNNATSKPSGSSSGSNSGSSGLMNQNINGNSLRNKLTDFGASLSKLKNDTSNSNVPQPMSSSSGFGSGNAQRLLLTPLPSKLTLDFDNGGQSLTSRRSKFDFRADTSKQVLNERPKQQLASFPAFKQRMPSNSNENEINNSTYQQSPPKISPNTGQPARLEQGNADKYREILKNAGYLLINGKRIQTTMDDLSSISELGSGTCGQVYKMVHIPTGYLMAVKQMGITGVAEENKRIIMDLDVVLKSHDCAEIVKCLGYFISDSDVWICMELMSMCFDKLLKQIRKPIPEDILGKVSVSTLTALNYLKEIHNVIHRDVKPSNILINSQGQIKLCDFGISGNLINSNAKSRNNTGCAGYMAPERIDPPDRTNPVYDIRADVWSLGLTLVELATGEYPYKKCKNEFEVMSTILYQDAPVDKLEQQPGQFTKNFKLFIKKCLEKDVSKRPKYNILLQDPFILEYKDPDMEVDVRAWFGRVIMEADSRDLTPVASMCNLSIVNHECDSTSTTPTATSNSIISMNST